MTNGTNGGRTTAEAAVYGTNGGRRTDEKNDESNPNAEVRMALASEIPHWSLVIGHWSFLLLLVAICSPAHSSLPSPKTPPGLRQGIPRSGQTPAPPAKRWIYGIGVGFERTGAAHGVPLSQVLRGSPADRAGLAAGTVIAEINGVSTIGHTDEECVRMVREAGSSVAIKFYDPSTMIPRTITILKESIPVPN